MGSSLSDPLCGNGWPWSFDRHLRQMFARKRSNALHPCIVLSGDLFCRTFGLELVHANFGAELAAFHSRTLFNQQQ